MLASTVGAGPGRYYAGVIVAVAAPLVTVRVADETDLDGNVVEFDATGTGTVGDRVNVLVQPTGRAILIRS
jgi:hypothetical protein